MTQSELEADKRVLIFRLWAKRYFEIPIKTFSKFSDVFQWVSAVWFEHHSGNTLGNWTDRKSQLKDTLIILMMKKSPFFRMVNMLDANIT